jgi:hypothetical protein
MVQQVDPNRQITHLLVTQQVDRILDLRHLIREFVKPRVHDFKHLLLKVGHRLDAIRDILDRST